MAECHTQTSHDASDLALTPSQDGTDLTESTSGQSAPVDKFAHTRGKRKRTSREDHAILESEYQKNARPDKATRISIVERVSLSEKEVQIWFQNRRQMTRRKCRTWQPNEISSIIRESQEQGTYQEGQSSAVEDNIHLTQSFSSEISNVRNRSRSPLDLPLSQEVPSSTEDLDRGTTALHRHTQSLDCAMVKSPYASRRSSDPIGHGLARSSLIPYSAVHVVEADDRTSSFSSSVDSGHAIVESNRAKITTSSQPQPIDSKRPRLKRTASLARLSTSIDGTAKVVVGNDSPSPFKKRAGPLERSQSALNPKAEADYVLGVDVSESRKAKHPHGRSRDARTWEFYCDSDARNALTKTAELDQHGSAQGVLGLIRSSSTSRKPLTPLRGENVPLQRTDSLHDMHAKSRVARTSKLERAMSSLGRLQGGSPKAEVKKAGKEVEIWQDNFGDSDKENEDPGRRPARRRTSISNLPEAHGLKESSGPKKKRLVKEGVASPGVTRPEAELDAVQQLLSLSKGAWR